MRLKGFTLIELVITMLISSIVVLIAFSSYEIISKQFLDYRKKSDEVAQSELLNMILQKDFTDSKCVLLTPDGNLKFTYDKGTDVEYFFCKNYITRAIPNVIADTFHFEPDRIIMQFEGISLGEGHCLVDEVTFNAKVLSLDVFYHFTKQYGADILMDEPTVQWPIRQNGI